MGRPNTPFSMAVWAATLLALLAAGLALAQSPPQRVALVIANSAYQYSSQFNNPRSDAALIEPALRRAGFTDVRVVYDQGIGPMRQELRAFQERARAAQVALVYYAGHSLEAGGENWLIPTDAQVRTDQDLEFEAINLNRIVLPAVAGAQMRLVLLDACRDNPLGDRMARSFTTRSSAPSGALAPTSADGVLILFATEPGRTATDGTAGQSSPFAKAVARWLPDPNTPVQLFGFRVRDEVKAATQGARRPQTPFVSASVTGEPFYLTARGSVGPDARDAEIARLRAELERQKNQPAPVATRPDVPSGAAAPSPLPSPPPAPSAARAPPPQSLRDGQTFRDCADCPEMVVIPAGSFVMGSPVGEAGRQTDEGPQRTVSISRFAAGKFEVTFDEWAACAAGGGCRSNLNPSDQGWGRGRRPVINVNWIDAQEYVAWLNAKIGATAPSPRTPSLQTGGGGGAAAPGPYRLLTEAEWEYAARAGTTGRFSNNGAERQLCQIANHADQSTSDSWKNSACSDGVGEQTTTVGRYAANSFGLYDVHGNVWEWVQDCYVNTYSGAPANASAVTTRDCSSRVLRGGSWFLNPPNLRSADRHRSTPTFRLIDFGFRLARTL